MASAVVSSEITKGANRLVRLSTLCDEAGISTNLQRLIDSPLARERLVAVIQASWDDVFGPQPIVELADRLNADVVREFIEYALPAGWKNAAPELTVDDLVQHFCDGANMEGLLNRVPSTQKRRILQLFFGFTVDGVRKTHEEIADELSIKGSRVRDMKREGVKRIGALLKRYIITGEPPEIFNGTPLHNLNLQERLVSALMGSDINTVEDLTDLTVDQLLEKSNQTIGSQYLEQIEQALMIQGLSLKD